MSSEEIVLYDVRKFQEVARTNVRARQVACHDYFSKSLASLMVPVEMAYYQSLRMYKGRLFIMVCLLAETAIIDNLTYRGWACRACGRSRLLAGYLGLTD